MAAIIDTFTRADNTGSLGVADSGQTWQLRSTTGLDINDNPITPVTSTLGINSNTAYSTDASHHQIATIDSEFANARLRFSLPTLPGHPPGGHGGGVVFRWSAAGEFWTAFIYRSSLLAGDHFLFVRKYTSATTYDDLIVEDLGILSASPVPMVRIEANADSIAAWITAESTAWVGGDERLLDTGVDSFNQTATHHGLAMFFSTATRLDDLNIEPMGGRGLRVGPLHMTAT